MYYIIVSCLERFNEQKHVRFGGTLPSRGRWLPGNKLAESDSVINRLLQTRIKSAHSKTRLKISRLKWPIISAHTRSWWMSRPHLILKSTHTETCSRARSKGWIITDFELLVCWTDLFSHPYRSFIHTNTHTHHTTTIKKGSTVNWIGYRVDKTRFGQLYSLTLAYRTV